MREVIERLEAFVAVRQTMGGIDPEVIHAVGTSAGQIELTTSDLSALLRLARAVEGLTNDLHLMNEQGETPDGDGITVNVQLWAERWLGRLVAAPDGE